MSVDAQVWGRPPLAGDHSDAASQGGTTALVEAEVSTTSICFLHTRRTRGTKGPL